MCQTAEEAARVFLEDGVASRDMRRLMEILPLFKGHVMVDITPNYALDIRVIKISCELLVSNQMWNQAGRTVSWDDGRSVVGGREGRKARPGTGAEHP